MKIEANLYNNIIRVRKNDTASYIYDVELDHIDRLKHFHSVELHIVLYPYSRKINSRDFEFNPFEEYVNDILMNQNSAYIKIKNSFSQLFGFFLGILIAAIFYFLKPDDLFTVQSIISVIGAYLVGKEIWDDIESVMVDISKEWRLRYQERYYRYRLEKNTTLSLYTQLAKKRRYGKSALLPEKMDFIQNSNSQTLRMCFHMKDLKDFNETTAHIQSIRIKPELAQDFENEGFMLGVKLGFNKRFLCITRCFEVFQSIDRNVKGCLDVKGEWMNGSLFYRNTFTAGRLKCFLNKDYISEKSVIDMIN